MMEGITASFTVNRSDKKFICYPCRTLSLPPLSEGTFHVKVLSLYLSFAPISSSSTLYAVR